MAYPPGPIPELLELRGEWVPPIPSTEGDTVWGDFDRPVGETREARFHFPSGAEAVSWIQDATDSISIGSTSPFGAFFFRGVLRGDTLEGEFRYSTDSGFFARAEAPIVARRSSCPSS